MILVFATASSVKSVVMKSVDMEKDKKDLEDLIAQAEAEMDLNPADFIQAGNRELMTQLQDVLDGHYKTCVQKLRDWRADYATVIDTTVETALTSKLAKLMQDLVAYKKLALAKQASLPAAVVPQPTNSVGQGDQLAKYLKQEAKGKMTVLYNKLKDN